MKVHATLHGGLGDMLLQIGRSGQPFGYLADAKAKGHETCIVIEPGPGRESGCAEIVEGLGHRLSMTAPPGSQPISSVFKKLSLEWRDTVFPIDEAQRVTVESIASPYIAVHLSASDWQRIPPEPGLLLKKLLVAKVPYVLVGHDGEGPKPKFLTHMAVVQRATGFLGVLSCFNCVAQLWPIPSYVMVNRSKKEPIVYGLMERNRARIMPWNEIDKRLDINAYYDAAVDWARSS